MPIDDHEISEFPTQFSCVTSPEIKDEILDPRIDGVFVAGSCCEIRADRNGAIERKAIKQSYILGGCIDRPAGQLIIDQLEAEAAAQLG